MVRWRQDEEEECQGDHLHLEGALGAKVSLEHLLEALSGVDVDAESGGLAHDIGLGVHKLKRGHCSVVFRVVLIREEVFAVWEFKF